MCDFLTKLNCTLYKCLWKVHYLFQCRIDMIISNMSRIQDDIFSSEDACTRKPAQKKKLTPTSVKVSSYLNSRSERGHVLVYISVCPFVCYIFFVPFFSTAANCRFLIFGTTIIRCIKFSIVDCLTFFLVELVFLSI